MSWVSGATWVMKPFHVTLSSKICQTALTNPGQGCDTLVLSPLICCHGMSHHPFSLAEHIPISSDEMMQQSQPPGGGGGDMVGVHMWVPKKVTFSYKLL